MNTFRVVRTPRIGLAVIALILLTLSSLGLFLSAWLAIHARPSQPPVQGDPLNMVNAFHSAMNNGDVDAKVAFFAVDATVNDNGSIFQSKNEIRRWLLHSPDITGCHFKMIYSQVNGEKIFWRDIAYSAFDASHASHVLQWMAVIQKDKIESLTVSRLLMPFGK